MKKTVTKDFLIRFIVSNLLTLITYLLVVMLVNILTGNALTVMTGTLESQGRQADDLSPGLTAFLTVFLPLLFLSTFALFYVFLYWRTAKNKAIHDAFMQEIGSSPFDRKAYAKANLKSGRGRQELIVFSVIMAAGAVLTALGIPFVTILLQPQDSFNILVQTFLPLSDTAEHIVEAILLVAVNIPAFYLYELFIYPRLCERWASKRLRID